MSSELALLMQQITEQEESAQRALYSPAAVARHDAIIARMGQGAETLVGLFKQGRDEEAFALWNGGILEVQQ